jgi:hypothetical protein
LLACGTSASPSPADGGFSFTETFAASDGAPWPAAWQPLGGVASATVVGGRGRLAPVASGYSLARMGVSAAQRDFEVTFQLRFEDVATQGIGFYLRQNGHYLQATAAHGSGYAIFVEGFRGSRMGVWREVDGVETEIANFTQFSAPLRSNQTYAARFRVTQASAAATKLQARLWDAAQPEPSVWQLDVNDATAGLQGALGGLAVDSYSSTGSGTIAVGTLVGNILVVGL